jgi:hypothetical protein
MTLITQKSLAELRKTGVNCDYALSPKGREFYLTSTGRTYGEAFDNFVGLLEEEVRECGGACEVRESDDRPEGLIRLIGRIITVKQSQLQTGTEKR